LLPDPQRTKQRALLNYPAAAATYGLLTLAIIALWIPSQVSSLPKGLGLWIIPLIVSLGIGLSAGFVHLPALLPITILGLACYLFSVRAGSGAIRALAGAVIVLLSIGLLAHIVPGFSNFKVISDAILSTGGIAYTKYLNFDKALVGLFILAFCHPLLTTKEQWVAMLRTAVPVAFAVICVVLLLSLMMGYVRWELKFPPQFYVWAWANLFFTCVAEEALFRGFLQRHFHGSLKGIRYGGILALVAASVLFGVAHYAGGVSYIVLATVAGLGYGWIYQRTNSIEASILTHFTLNAAHFVFFTYPALRR
jgi:CAAX protease family protein